MNVIAIVAGKSPNNQNGGTFGDYVDKKNYWTALAEKSQQAAFAPLLHAIRAVHDACQEGQPLHPMCNLLKQEDNPSMENQESSWTSLAELVAGQPQLPAIEAVRAFVTGDLVELQGSPTDHVPPVIEGKSDSELWTFRTLYWLVYGLAQGRLLHSAVAA